jgi:hypothetical protein
MKYVLGLLFVVLAPCASFGQVIFGSPLVRFNNGIGVIPGATNTVRGVAPAGQPWVISNLRVVVTTDGHISVTGLGLVLAGGDSIGTAGGQTVFATLFCGSAASATASNSSTVILTVDGAFAINDGILTPPPPNPCTTPVLLIRTTGGTQPWFAAGIPQPATP